MMQLNCDTAFYPSFCCNGLSLSWGKTILINKPFKDCAWWFDAQAQLALLSQSQLQYKSQDQAQAQAQVQVQVQAQAQAQLNQFTPFTPGGAYTTVNTRRRNSNPLEGSSKGGRLNGPTPSGTFRLKTGIAQFPSTPLAPASSRFEGPIVHVMHWI